MFYQGFVFISLGYFTNFDLNICFMALFDDFIYLFLIILFRATFTNFFLLHRIFRLVLSLMQVTFLFFIPIFIFSSLNIYYTLSHNFYAVRLRVFIVYCIKKIILRKLKKYNFFVNIYCYLWKKVIIKYNRRIYLLLLY